MIAVNPPPPLKSTAQRSYCNPNPTRLHHHQHHRRCSFPVCFTLSSRRRSGDVMLPAGWSKAREFFQRLWDRQYSLLAGASSRSDVGGGEVVNDDGGGEDVNDDGAEPDHLVIMVNGINGSDADWRYAAEEFQKNLPKKVSVHCSTCNHAKLTLDGVDKMGDRLADEVKSLVEGKPNMKKISFVAHSLGGLVARYAIGKLYEEPSGIDGSRSKEENTNNSTHCLGQHFGGKIAGLEPMNFVTVATPHLGSKGHKQLPFLCGLSFLEKNAPRTAHLIAGRSGRHLFLTDDDGIEGKPLLLIMVNDSGDRKFISALRAFKRRVAYANANYDHMVGWRTSSIRRQSELPKSNQLVSNEEKYPHIVHIERGSTYVHNEVPSEQICDPEEEMIRGLTKVSWERVDVSFQTSRQRFIAHNTIQVKRYWLNSDGADVVSHIIDNFLLDSK